MTERTRTSLTTVGTLLSIAAILVAAVVFIANANNKAEAASVQVKEVEVRLRSVETTIPRIDEKLGNIERMLIEHQRDKR